MIMETESGEKKGEIISYRTTPLKKQQPESSAYAANVLHCVGPVSVSAHAHFSCTLSGINPPGYKSLM